MKLSREQQLPLEALLSRHPAVGLLGPRQAGKTTLARSLSRPRPTLYLDLESPLSQAKLSDPLSFFASHPEPLIILDEIQRAPELFQVLRGIIDEDRRQGAASGRFLILGSASLDLLQQSSESLAGRIAYLELGPFSATEVPSGSLAQLWLRGGFPQSFLAEDNAASVEWRQAFIRTYLERDVPQFGPRVPAETLRRFWTMLAHNQGTPLNAARLAAALGVSGVTVSRYLDLLVDLLLVRRLTPWLSNSGKRLTRSPKVYVRDAGLVHALLNIVTMDGLLGHPVAGASWEGLVIENLLSHLPFGADAGFYRSAGGAEIDLVLSLPPDQLWAIEIKRGTVPKIERGFHAACADLQPTERFVIYPGTERFSLGSGVTAIGLAELMGRLRARQ